MELTMEKRVFYMDALNYFKEHQEELVEKYNGKELLMHGAKVVGAFDTVAEAADEGRKLFGRNNYTVQTCIPGPDAYTFGISPSLWGLFVCK